MNHSAVIAAALAAIAAAQGLMAQGAPASTAPPTSSPPAPTGSSEWVVLGTYSEATSRAAFAACDRNGDDRLDLFESAACLEPVHGVRDTQSFRGLDRDGDGALSWPEFDRLYRDYDGAGSALRLRPLRPLSIAPGPAASRDGTSSEAIQRALDQDKDGIVTVAELEAKLKALDVPAAIMTRLAALDMDRSGRLEAAELAILAPWFPGMAAPSSSTMPLPEPLRAVDADGDGALGQGEVAEALRRLDPGLTRWTDRVLRDADASGNGVLGALEIQRSERLLRRDE